MRRVAPVALLLAVSFLMSGCFRLDVDARVGRDQTVQGTITAAIERDQLDEAGIQVDEDDPAAVLGQVFNLQAFDALEDSDEVDVDVEEFVDDDTVGLEMTFDDLSMREFVQLVVGSQNADGTSTAERYVFERDGDVYRFEVGADEQEAAYAQQVGEQLDFRLALTFPGDIVETDGQVENRTVSWTSYEDVANGVSVTSVVPTGASDTERLWTGAGLAIVLVVAAGCAFAWRRPRG
jgi:hypothetical protein